MKWRVVVFVYTKYTSPMLEKEKSKVSMIITTCYAKWSVSINVLEFETCTIQGKENLGKFYLSVFTRYMNRQGFESFTWSLRFDFQGVGTVENNIGSR
jgi:hypothetical protein